MKGKAMAERNSLMRFLHDAGLAAWFGGSLMGAVGLNGASAELANPGERTHVSSAGWARWTPINATAIVMHLMGSVALMWNNKARLVGQRRVASAAATKTGLTLAAVGATAYARALGERVMAASHAPSEDATTPSEQTAPEIAEAQRRLGFMQWMIPTLTGALVAVNAVMGEQQRPAQVGKGLLERLSPTR
jgi:hypothetical protein